MFLSYTHLPPLPSPPPPPLFSPHQKQFQTPGQCVPTLLKFENGHLNENSLQAIQMPSQRPVINIFVLCRLLFTCTISRIVLNINLSMFLSECRWRNKLLLIYANMQDIFTYFKLATNTNLLILPPLPPLITHTIRCIHTLHFSFLLYCKYC